MEQFLKFLFFCNANSSDMYSFIDIHSMSFYDVRNGVKKLINRQCKNKKKKNV